MAFSTVICLGFWFKENLIYQLTGRSAVKGEQLLIFFAIVGDKVAQDRVVFLHELQLQ